MSLRVGLFGVSVSALDAFALMIFKQNRIEVQDFHQQFKRSSRIGSNFCKLHPQDENPNFALI